MIFYLKKIKTHTFGILHSQKPIYYLCRIES